ncbi:Pre-mRNA-splicing factor RBM22 [Cladochytrium replicatum]|nr:Pre-mRNA-splicing factor RBM22 [Cladochytrium replicatum]
MAKQGWEQSDFPILCETCLGNNPYVRMMKEGFGKECKICGRPFTVFRWSPGQGMRFKKTEICQTCAKIKNVCQTCVLDLEYSLPTQVRDSVLATQNAVPLSDGNREWFVANMESKLGPADTVVDSSKASATARDALQKLARSDPNYQRNRPHLCTFYAKGECKRGDECPYRHELPVENELSHQNIKDRYHGKNDPVAKKILTRTDIASQLNPPADKSIMSLFITGVEGDITEAEIRGYFQAFGELKSVVMVYKSKCAFVNFTSRQSAELAAERSFNNLILKDHALKVQWGKAKALGPRGDTVDGQQIQSAMMYGVPMPPPPGAGMVSYPSMNPDYLGSSAKTYRP